MAKKIAIIGECMLELRQHSNPTPAPGEALPMALSYGGDTLNTAVYLARLGCAVDYVTALGDDNMSEWMLQQWRSEGVGCALVERYPNCVPGLYMIQTDEYGERSFLYWRESAPAKRLFDDDAKAHKLFSMLSGFDWLYLSGITLALFTTTARQRLFNLLADYRRDGGKVIFDDNYRPRLWSGDAAAQKAYATLYELTDIALPTLEDEQLLFGDKEQETVVSRLQSWGVAEIVLKMGEQGCLVITDAGRELVGTPKVAVVDTTSAGDAFNAGYLAARMSGETPQQAACAGHRLASVVIQHRGAIIPAAAMPA